MDGGKERRTSRMHQVSFKTLLTRIVKFLQVGNMYFYSKCGLNSSLKPHSFSQSMKPKSFSQSMQENIKNKNKKLKCHVKINKNCIHSLIHHSSN